MPENLDAVEKVTPPDEAFGSALGLKWTRDDCLSYFELNVHYRVKATGADKGTAQIVISDGVIGDAMKVVHAEAVAEHGGEPGDEGYPISLDCATVWAQAKNQIANGATAEELVTLLSSSGPAGQKWGRQILLDNIPKDMG